MTAKKIKIEKTLETRQIAAFLRLLAAELERQGGRPENLGEYGVDLHNFNKIKIGLIRKEGGQLTLKLKVRDESMKKQVKTPKNDTAFEDVASLKYRPLKKQMKNTFALLRREVKAGSLPGKKDMERFMEEAKLMTSYPGFGDEHYEPFLKVCQTLESAYKKEDLAGMSAALDELNTMKVECHQRYK